MGLEKKRFDKIVEDIKSIKIQGAKNVARSALDAYMLIPSESSIKTLVSARPTEPMLFNVLRKIKTMDSHKILYHFDEAQEKINQKTLDIIKNNDIIFTHCHSTNVINALIYAKKKGKKFEVYNTETRPLYQGRKTAKQLQKAGIKVTMFIDSALDVALSNKKIKVDKVFLGADALLRKGIINKIGSGLIAKIAKGEKIPIYIIADSWKYSEEKIPIEQRKMNEVWDKAPKKIKIKNPAFEFVPKNYISKIISEFGVLSYNEFLKKVKRINPSLR